MWPMLPLNNELESCWCQKLTEHVKIIIQQPELKFESKRIQGRYLWHKVVWFVLAAMLEGILLPSNMAAKTTVSLYLVKHVIVMLRCAVNVGTYFQYFPWSLSAHFVFRKRYFIISKITFWSCNHFKKMVRLWKTK